MKRACGARPSFTGVNEHQHSAGIFRFANVEIVKGEDLESAKQITNDADMVSPVLDSPSTSNDFRVQFGFALPYH